MPANNATMSSTLEKLLQEKIIYVYGNGLTNNQKQREQIFKTEAIFRARAEYIRVAATPEARAAIDAEHAEKRAATRALQAQIDVFAAFDKQARQQ